MESSEWSEQDWLNKARRYCASSEHCENEVRMYLKRWQVAESLADNIIASLKAEGYVDDLRFCKAYVHDKVAFNGWGRQKLKMMLRGYGIDSEMISTALDGIDTDAYNKNIEKLIRQKKGQPADKILSSLLQRGYEYDEIKDFIRID